MSWKWDGYPQQEVSGFLFFLSFTVFPSFSALSLHSVVFPIFISSLFLCLKSVFLFPFSFIESVMSLAECCP